MTPRKCGGYTAPAFSLPCEAECIATKVRNVLTTILPLYIPFTVFLVKNNGVCALQCFLYRIYHSDVLQPSYYSVDSKSCSICLRGFAMLLGLEERASSGGFLAMCDK